MACCLQADKALLTAVQGLQTKLRATNEDTATVVGEFARSNIEAALGKAIQVMQLRGQKRDVSPAITVGTMPSLIVRCMLRVASHDLACAYAAV